MFTDVFVCGPESPCYFVMLLAVTVWSVWECREEGVGLVVVVALGALTLFGDLICFSPFSPFLFCT